MENKLKKEKKVLEGEYKQYRKKNLRQRKKFEEGKIKSY